MRSVLFLLLTTISFSLQAAGEPYHLRAGDTVLISVWGEENLNREVRVLPDGSVSFPLAGRVVAAGRTLPELELSVVERLKPFLADPVVTAVATGIEGHKVYVLGKVNNPGAVVLSEPMTVLQALSLTGGLNTFADGNRIQVLRQAADARGRLLEVRYDDLIRGRELQTNVVLQPGDTVLVP